MKKHLIFLSLVLAAFTFASCAVKGGTIEVKNGSNLEAYIAVYKGIVQVTASEKAAPGNKVTFSIDEDGTYIINALFHNDGTDDLYHGSGEAVLIGGNKVSVTVKPTD
jgi:hypothetical protein